METTMSAVHANCTSKITQRNMGEEIVMEKKTRRKTASFSFNEETIRKFESYCNKKRINRSRLVEDLVIEFLNGNNTHPKESQNVVS